MHQNVDEHSMGFSEEILLRFAVFSWRRWEKQVTNRDSFQLCEISSSHGGEYEVQNCLLG
jgi:hypothetical protein